MSFLRILATSDFHGRLEAFHRTVQKAKEIEARARVVRISLKGCTVYAQTRFSQLYNVKTLRMPITET